MLAKAKLLLLTGGALAAPLMAQTTSAPATQTAATAPAGGVEEIVVTAERRETNLQETPISITALTAAAIESQGVRQINDLGGSVPNLTATTGPQGSADANFFLRGIGQVDFIATNDPAVGVYVDGIYLGRTSGAMVDSSDVERIEVLRGPQGTLFGRNTLGGAVSITTRQPDTDALSGRIRVTGGSRNRIDADGSINLPLSESAAIRIGAFTRNQDGFARRDDGVRFGAIKREGARAQLLLKPTDGVTVNLSADYSLDRSNPAPSVLLAIAPLPFFPAAARTQIQDPNNFYRVFASNSPRSRNRIYGFSGTVAFELGEATLKSITAYRNLDNFSTSDPDGTSFRLYDQQAPTKQNQFSQELQLSGRSFDNRLDYLVGAYFFRERVDQTLFLCFAPITPVPTAFFNPCNTWNQGNNQLTKSYAAFGQVRFAVNDMLSFTLGGRYTKEDKSNISNQAFDFRPAGTPFNPAPGSPPPGLRILAPIVTNLAGDLSFERFTPKVGFELKPSEQVLVFGSYSQGFRSGGFNGRLIVPQATIPTYGPDKNFAWELGFKSDSADRRLRFNATAFYSIYRDIQQSLTVPVIQFAIQNSGRARLYGFEAELTAVPTETFRLNAALGYTNSRFTSIAPGGPPVVGNSLPFAPRWSGTVGAEADLAFNGFKVVPRVDFRFQSRTFFTALNLPFEQQAAYGLLGARITVTDPSERFTLAVFGENLTDREYYTFGQNALANQGVAYNYLGRPREFGVTAGIRF